MMDDARSFPDDLTGYFLIAETELHDPNFFRTVVLMVSHNSDGAFGLVINRRSDVLLGEVVEDFEDSPVEDLPVFVGGPVQQNYIFSLHSGIPTGWSSEHVEEPAPGVFFEPSFQHLADFMGSDEFGGLPAQERPRVHVYAGYSGWGPGQLEGELEEGAWLVHPAQAPIVFHDNPEEGWREALSKKGSFYRIVAQTGFKPSLN